MTIANSKTKMLNDDEIRSLFKRTAERAYDKMLNSKRGREILAEADRYGIPYNMYNRGINWLDLIDQIKSYQDIEDGKHGALARHRFKYGRDYSYA